MKKIQIIVFVVIVALFMGVGLVQADNSEAAAEVDVYATVLATITLETIEDMYFGAGTSPQSDSANNIVTLGTDGTTAIDFIGFWDGSTAQAAELTVTGQEDRVYAVSIDGTAVAHGTAASLATPVLLGGVLEVNNFIVVEAGNGSFDNDNGGTDTLLIGAELFIPNDQPAGDYSGSFQVTVAYE